MKKIFLLMLVSGILSGTSLFAQGTSFEKIIGKNASTLDPGSFRFMLGAETRNDKWGSNDYASAVFPIDLSLGLTHNIEMDFGGEFNKPYSFIDQLTIKDKMSFHNFYGGVRIFFNPETVHTKPAIGFWLGLYFPLHLYEAWKPTASFLLSSTIGSIFSWNFNLGLAWYVTTVDAKYDPNLKHIEPGGEVNTNVEFGYKMNDFLKGMMGFDVKAHFKTVKYYHTGGSDNLDEFYSFKTILAVRFKPQNIPINIDGGFKIGLNKQADESFSVFVRLQIIPDSPNAAW